jgi:DNA-binding transcriptional regulator YhcF (GntR family)
MELSRHQPTPLYYQLKTRLIEEILSGTYGTDGRLPTEHELCKQFGMSRTPVTRAVSELAAEGVVLRRRRHGTFVNPHWLARRADSAEVRVMVPDDAGDHGTGFGPKMNVPGLGKVDIPSTIDQQAEQVGPGTQMKQLVWDWPRLVNQQVPYLTYATKVYQFPHSSQRFTNWPPMNAQGTSPLWNILARAT